MHAPYFPGADHEVQNFEAAYPSSIRRIPDALVLHTTEGSTWPGYNGGKSAPHMTGMTDWKNKRINWRQHYAATRYARALRDAPGGVTTNVGEGSEGKFQIELVGTSGWASAQNAKAPYHASPLVPDMPDWYWLEVAKVLAWLHIEHDVPLTAIADVFPQWGDGGKRMTGKQWTDFKGVCGHVHVPENDHTDPGAIPAHKIIEHTRRLTGQAGTGTEWTTPEGDDPAYLREGMSHPKVQEIQSWAAGKWAWARAITAPAGGADGKYGPATTALVATLQERLNAQAAREKWSGWERLEVDGKWGPATEAAARTKSGFRKPAPKPELEEKPVTPTPYRRYPAASKIGTDEFWAELEAIITEEGYTINCGPSDYKAGRCAPGKHPHSRTSRHFAGRAIDPGRNPRTGEPVSAYEQAYLSALGLRLRDLYPDMGLVLMRGPGDHEDHLHAQDKAQITPNSFRPDLSGAPAGVILYGMRGDRVKALQRSIGVTPDGVFGLETFDALRAAQAKAGLKVDGIAGPASFKMLGVTR